MSPSSAFAASRLPALRATVLLVLACLLAAFALVASAPAARADAPTSVVTTPQGAVAPGATVTYEFTCAPTDGDRDFTLAYAIVDGANELLASPLGDDRYRFDYSGPRSADILLACFYETSGFGTPVTYDVVPQAAVTLTYVRNPIAVGDRIVADVTVTGADGTPTGSVYLSGVLFSCTPLQQGTSRCTSLGTAFPNTFGIRAVYSGDATYGEAVSEPASISVLRAQTTTTATVVTDGTPSIGEPTTVRVDVQNPPTDTDVFDFNPVTGTVEVRAGDAVLCSITITDAPIECQISLPVGTSDITATYSGDYLRLASTSAPQRVVVQGATPTVTVTTDATATTTAGDVVLATVRVDGELDTPTGTVAIGTGAGDAVCAAAPLVDGVATCRIALPAGATTVTATYSGDATYATGTATTTATATAPAAPVPSTPPSEPAVPAPSASPSAPAATPAATAPAVAAHQAGAALPRTGDGVEMWLAGLAMLLVAAGAAGLVARRVRRP
ncbi:hypothetical protein GCM10009846_02850 [Agrococcus versicolor]|uniref:Gram-positive cocci surface proteins LPxTG domain-containing protein n=1 Tax=Agrococcus versicolor TaxID=501482 RepID=A0ABP5MDD3_9MICO